MKLIEHEDVENALLLAERFIGTFPNKLNLVLYGREEECYSYAGYHPAYVGICVIPVDDEIVLPRVENGKGRLDYFIEGLRMKQMYGDVRTVIAPNVTSKIEPGLEKLSRPLEFLMPSYDIFYSGVPVYVGHRKIMALVRSLMFRHMDSPGGKMMVKDDEKLNQLDELYIIYGDRFRFLESTLRRMEGLKGPDPHDGRLEVLVRDIGKPLDPRVFDQFP